MDKLEPNFIRQIYQMIKGGFDGLTKAVNKDVHKIELAGAEVVTIKGQRGDPGLDGHTPTDQELLDLIKPLIPEIKQPKDGKTPTETELLALIRPLIPKVKDGETPSDARLLALIKTLIVQPDTTKVAQEASRIVVRELRPYIPKVESPEIIAEKLGRLRKQWIPIDAIIGDFNTKVSRQFGAGGKIELQVADEEGENFYVDKIKFAGSGVTVDSLGNRVAQVNIQGSGEVGVVDEVIAGPNIEVDSTDPTKPVVSATGLEPELGNPATSGFVLSSTDTGTRSWVEMSGGSGGVDSVVGGSYVSINNADPANPIINVDGVEPDLGTPSADGQVLYGNLLGVRYWGDLPTVTGPTWKKETPTGLIDGENTTYTLSDTPVVGSLFLFLNSRYLTEDIDYTLVDKTISMTDPIPVEYVGLPFHARYQKA